jgi:hypothetical protein
VKSSELAAGCHHCDHGWGLGSVDELELNDSAIGAAPPTGDFDFTMIESSCPVLAETAQFDFTLMQRAWAAEDSKVLASTSLAAAADSMVGRRCWEQGRQVGGRRRWEWGRRQQTPWRGSGVRNGVASRGLHGGATVLGTGSPVADSMAAAPDFRGAAALGTMSPGVFLRRSAFRVRDFMIPEISSPKRRSAT